MNRSIFFPVHWLTDFGGLHENVFDTVAALRSDWRCVVMAPKAKFNDRLRALDVHVIEHDLDDINDAARLALAAGPFDLVHAHPFAGRAVGSIVAKACNAKFILTIHGQYVDQIDDVDMVICVAEGVAQYFRNRVMIDSSRIRIIQNAVDVNAFQAPTPDMRTPKKIETLVISVCSRIDPDKVILLECINDLSSHIADIGLTAEVRIYGQNMYGDLGNYLPALKQKLEASGSVLAFKGWIDDRAGLARAFNESDIVIGSGRAAAEALCCLRPTIAVASRGYVGLLDHRTLDTALYTNFGGCLETATIYNKSRLVTDFRLARTMPLPELIATRGAMLRCADVSIVRDQHRALVRELLM